MTVDLNHFLDLFPGPATFFFFFCWCFEALPVCVTCGLLWFGLSGVDSSQFCNLISPLWAWRGGSTGRENTGAGPRRTSPLTSSTSGDNLTQIEPSLRGLCRLVSWGGRRPGDSRWHFEEAVENWPFEETSLREARSLISLPCPPVSQLTVLLDFAPRVWQILWKDVI